MSHAVPVQMLHELVSPRPALLGLPGKMGTAMSRNGRRAMCPECEASVAAFEASGALPTFCAACKLDDDVALRLGRAAMGRMARGMSVEHALGFAKLGFAKVGSWPALPAIVGR